MRFAYRDVGEGREQGAEASFLSTSYGRDLDLDDAVDNKKDRAKPNGYSFIPESAMLRPARLNLPDISQHATQRGNNRQVCFFSDNVTEKT